jgi:hypothetical protein
MYTARDVARLHDVTCNVPLYFAAGLTGIPSFVLHYSDSA